MKRNFNGLSSHPLFAIWRAMVSRCTNPKDAAYTYYGGRGITACEEWCMSFPSFIFYMGDKPSEKHTLGRIDNSQGYKPGNVRWETRYQQQNNIHSNKFTEVNGQKLTIAQLSRLTGLRHSTLTARIARNWPSNLLISAPRPHNKRRHKVYAD